MQQFRYYKFIKIINYRIQINCGLKHRLDEIDDVINFFYISYLSLE